MKSAGPASVRHSREGGNDEQQQYARDLPTIRPMSADLIDRIDRLLPQTQCGQCGYDGCRPYAEAMARHEADIDRCPPGGDAGARTLARLLDVPEKPYDRTRGTHKPP